jgi:hypothetical protein
VTGHEEVDEQADIHELEEPDNENDQNEAEHTRYDEFPDF